MKGFLPHFTMALAVVAFALPTLGFCIKRTDAEIQAAGYKTAGINVVPCPRYIAKLSTGLYTSINPGNTLCITEYSSKKATTKLKAYKKKSLILDGRLKGSAFEPVSQQEGDVNTSPFSEVNYPVAIRFDMAVPDEAYTAPFKMQVRSMIDGTVVKEAEHGKAPKAGWIDWIGSGNFFFKINALPDSHGNQPIFDVDMTFMDQYEGSQVYRQDLKENGIKTVSCPDYLVEFYGKQLFKTKGFVCSNSRNLADAGLTAAPLNLRQGIFLSQDISDAVMDGAGQGFPFRVIEPTTLTYTVDDPGVPFGKKGSVEIRLYNLATGKEKSFASFDGSIAATSTYINFPGDYAVIVKATPKDREKYGETAWSISVTGTD